MFHYCTFCLAQLKHVVIYLLIVYGLLRYFKQNLCDGDLSNSTEPVTPKLVWLDLFWQKNLPKPVPWTTFAAKIGPAGPILAAKTGSLCQFWSLYKM